MGIDFFAQSPVLQSLQPVIDGSRNVHTNRDAIERVASWMAYEEFGIPGGLLQFDMGRDTDVLADMIMLANSLNFAYTDFDTSVKFEVEYEGAALGRRGRHGRLVRQGMARRRADPRPASGWPS